MILFLSLFAVFDYSVLADAFLTYDDNIFAYSRKSIDEFIAHTHPERYPFETYDDLKADLSLELRLRSRMSGRRTTTVSLSLDGHNYYLNRAKDYAVYKAGIRQAFDRFAVRIDYLLMPGYLIRYYRNPAAADYAGCSFTEHLVTLKGSYRIGRGLTVSASFKRELDDYVETFDAYDAESFRFEAEIAWQAADFIEPGLAYEFKDSRAEGPVPDVSYIQHQGRFTVNLRSRMPRLSAIEFGFLTAYRQYTTELSPLIDAPHSGRADLKNRLSITGKVPVAAGLKLLLDYGCEFRHSFSDQYPQIGELKDYRQQTAGCGIEFVY